MKFICLVIVGWCGAGLVLAPYSQGQETPAEIIKRGKAATAYLISRDGSATAFCIDPKGVFVTNHHAVERVGLGNRLTLVMNSGAEDEKRLPAVVLSWRLDKDLALLKTIEEQQDLPALTLGDSESLIETQRLAAFGYPLGARLAISGTTNPTISVSGGTVTSLRKKQGKLEIIQVDNNLNPGNSGGPVLDKQGRVVGVVMAGIPGAGLNFLLPVEDVKQFLSKPLLHFEPVAVTSERMTVPQEFTAQCSWPVSTAQETIAYFLELEVKGRETRKIPLELKQGSYRALVAPVASTDGGQKFSVLAQLDSGQVQGKVADFSFKLDDQTFWFRDVKSLTPADDKSMIMETSTETLQGTPKGLNAIEVDLGVSKLRIDAQKSVKIVVSPERTYTNFRASVVAISDDTEVGRVSYDLQFSGRVTLDAKRSNVYPTYKFPLKTTSNELDAGTVEPSQVGSQAGQRSDRMTTAAKDQLPVPIKLPPSLGKEMKIDLPGRVTQLTVGGGGRFLIAYCSGGKIVIFDFNAGKIINHMTPKVGPGFMAASNSKLILISPEDGSVARWDLLKGEFDKGAAIPFPTRVLAVAMGSSSNGPLLALCEGDKTAGREFELEAMDLDTLRSSPLNWDHSMHTSLGNDSLLCASDDGQTFGLWNPNAKPTGIGVLKLVGTRVANFYRKDSTSHVSPTSDGQAICTSLGIFRGDLGSMPQRVAESRLTFPVHGQDFILSGSYQSNDGDLIDLQVCLSNSPETPVGTFPGLDIDDDSRLAPSIAPYERVQYIASVNTLVVFPRRSQYFLLKQLDMEAGLAVHPGPFLLVRSTPPENATVGVKYQYQVVAKTKTPGLTYKLLQAPEGMKVSSRGLISWQPTEDEASTTQKVQLQLTSGSGLSHIHSFTLKVMQR